MSDVGLKPGRRRRRLGLMIAGLAVWVAALIAGIVALIVTGGLGAGGPWAEEVVREGDVKVAMVEVAGEIVPGRNPGGVFAPIGFGSDDIVSQLLQARDDDDVRAVIVRLDTPGGAVVASDAIYGAVREVRARKPVIALMDDVAASGGYYVAAGANSIVANRATVTGSIGVIALFPNLEGTAKKLGVQPIVIKSGRLKDIGSPLRRMTPEELRILQGLIDEAFGQFVEAVATGRTLPVATVRRLADGRPYSGAQAKRLGLVDRLGGLDEAIAEASQAAKITGDVHLVRYVRPIGFAESVFGVRLGLGRDQLLPGTELADVARRSGLAYLWLG